MKTFSGPVVAALSGPNLAIVQLIALGFSSPVYLNTSTWNLTFGGNVYKGAAGLGAVSAVQDKPGEIQGITLSLFGDAATIALALDAADTVQGTSCVIRTAIIETTNYTVLDAPTDWVGYLDTMSISEGSEEASVSVTAESKAVALLRGTAVKYSDADQRAIEPTDKSFSFATDQNDRPIVWPSKDFFRQ